jgi:hypothetical protein
MENILDKTGEFTWMFGPDFFIETNEGNFIWKDPDYNGDNTLRPYAGNYHDFVKECKVPYGRDKGKHIIKEYCGPDVRII